MNDNKTHIELLNKLIEGTLSNEEKWKLDRLSLDDPFLAEAIEGFYDNKYDSNEIKRMVFLKKKNRRIVIRPLAVAASIILLIGVSYVFYLQNDKNQFNNQILMNETDSAVPDPEVAEHLIQDENESERRTKLNESKRTPVKEQNEDKPTPTLKSNKKKNPTGNGSNRSMQDPSMKEELKTTMDAGRASYAMEASEIAEEVSEVQALAPINTRGIIIDELGNPVTGAIIKNSSGIVATRSGSDGRFKLSLNTPRDFLITSFNGYENDSTPVAEEMSIELKRAEGVFGQEHKALEELMSENDLIRLYRQKLDKVFKTQLLQCPRQIIRYEVKLKLTIDQSNQIEKLEFMQKLSEDCENEIRKIIEDASFNRLFNGDKKVSFFYDIKR